MNDLRRRYSPEVKVKALEMYVNSKPVIQIASELDVPVETVKSWVYGRREGAEEVTPKAIRTGIESTNLGEAVKRSKIVIANLLSLLDENIQRLREANPELTLYECNEAANLVAKLSFSMERISKIELTYSRDSHEELLSPEEARSIIASDPFMKPT